MSDKLKILVVKANDGGCAYYRAISPFSKLQELYPDKVEVIIEENPLKWPEPGKVPEGWEEDHSMIKNTHVVFINNLNNRGAQYTARLVGLGKQYGKFVHFDTDDLLTELYEEHKLAGVYKDQGLSEITKFIYSNCDLVTVTQLKFAERIKPFCTKVLAVIKNAIDYRLPAWNFYKQPSKQVRIGWAGGIHHNPDVKVFAGVPHLVNQKVGRENVRWDFYGHPPMPPPGQKKDWQFEAWNHYKTELLRGFKGQANWGIHYALPPNDYGAFYANMDIAIAPLKMNPFNDSKSDIKIAEAGRYASPLIASNVGCYNETIINGKTGYLLDPDAPKSEWARILSKVCKDHKHREEIGRNLKAVTDELFDLNKVVGQRLDIYEQAFKMVGWDPRNPVKVQNGTQV